MRRSRYLRVQNVRTARHWSNNQRTFRVVEFTETKQNTVEDFRLGPKVYERKSAHGLIG